MSRMGKLAGELGFEPRISSSRARRLTAWPLASGSDRDDTASGGRTTPGGLEPSRRTSGTLPTVNPEPDEAPAPDALVPGRDATGSPPPPSPRHRSRYIPAILDAVIPGPRAPRGRSASRRTPLPLPDAHRDRRRDLDRPDDVGPPAGRVPAGVRGHLGPPRGPGPRSSCGAWRRWCPACSTRRLPKPGRRDALPIAILLLVMVAPQAYAGYATETARETADEIFVEPSPVAVLPSAEPEPDPSNLDDGATEPVAVAVVVALTIGVAEAGAADQRPDRRRGCRRRAATPTSPTR